MNLNEFKKFIKEGQFDNVNLGSPNMSDMIKRTRHNTAEIIRSLVGEGEVGLEMTVRQLLQILES
jgi:hypothetical protein